MGYHVRVMEAALSIAYDKLPSAIDCVRGLNAKMAASWVSRDVVENALSDPDPVEGFIMAMAEWGYSFYSDGEKVGFEDREREKLGDDEALFAALASVISPGGEMVWAGEDDSFWRWRFDGKVMHEDEGYLEWR